MGTNAEFFEQLRKLLLDVGDIHIDRLAHIVSNYGQHQVAALEAAMDGKSQREQDAMLHIFGSLGDRLAGVERELAQLRAGGGSVQ